MKARFGILLCVAGLLIAACDDDDDNSGPQLSGDSKTYTLSSVSNPDISGTVTFEERDDNQTVITIELNGTASGGSHPAHIHANSAAEGGGIVLDLNPVDGATGRSETVVSALNDGTAITYDDLLAYNGHVNVHESSAALETLIAQGDIGTNELTGDSKVYALHPVADTAVTGDVTFAERVDGSTLITIQLEGTEDGQSYPAHIHQTTVAESGPIVIDLTNLDGTSGMSVTNVRTMNDSTPITYDELLEFDGYLNVHTGSTFVVQGDIGQNELTDTATEYALSEVNGSGVTGTATFTRRVNGTTLVTLQLEGTPPGGDHPAHIHNNNAATGGSIAIDLNNVNGDNGRSVTSVRQLNDQTAITYEGLLDFNGHVNVHLSPDDLATLVAQGDIGANAQ